MTLRKGKQIYYFLIMIAGLTVGGLSGGSSIVFFPMQSVIALLVLISCGVLYALWNLAGTFSEKEMREEGR